MPKTQEELRPNADIGRQTMQLTTPIKYVQTIGRALKKYRPTPGEVNHKQTNKQRDEDTGSQADKEASIDLLYRENRWDTAETNKGNNEGEGEEQKEEV